MGDKTKMGFSIKLSEETSEKLKTTIAEVSAKVDVTETSVAQEQPQATPPEVEVPESEKPIVEKLVPLESQNSDKSSNGNDADFAEHVRYEGNDAIYTDPSTKQEYLWSTEKNEWTVRISTSLDSDKPKDEDRPTEQTGQRYGFENDTHTYTDTDGSVYFWDKEKNAWFPKVDDEFLAHYQMAYGFVDNATPKPEQTPSEEMECEERKPEPPPVMGRKPPEEPKWFDLPEDQNNKVYVSNLPLDITEEEFVDVMQKCGLVMRDPSTQKMKIKLYTKPNSKALKGDALCTYIKVESVELALNILDGYAVRDHRIKVQRAQFQMKGDFNPALKPKKKRKKDKEKLKKMQERLFDWRPEKLRGERAKNERVVIIKNLFEPSLFDKEVHLILEYQQDMRDECSKCGEVKKVLLYDRHPEGVAQVTMKEAEDAENVVKLINGRWFGKRQLSAEIWDGKTKYKMEETDADLNKRIDEWNKFLDDDEKGDGGKVKPSED